MSLHQCLRIQMCLSQVNIQQSYRKQISVEEFLYHPII